MLRRRQLAAWLPLFGVPLGISGCGFALRQTLALPFQKIALTGFAPRSPLADELRRALAEQVQVVDSVNGADIVLNVVLDRRERSVVAATATAQTRELQLRQRFEYALAKAQEESQLFAAMQTDVVQQVMRRLAQVKPG